MVKPSHSQILAIVVLLVTDSVSLRSLAAPPPNDNFVNRTFLTGNSNEFGGTLAEATVEHNTNGMHEAYGPYITGLAYPPASIWWSWTASESGPVTLQMLELPPDSRNSDGINVWALTSLDGFPTNQWPVYPATGMTFDAATPGMWVTFTSEAGMSYQIQLTSARRGSFRLRLVARGEPFVFEHPRSQTIAPRINQRHRRSASQ